MKRPNTTVSLRHVRVFAQEAEDDRLSGVDDAHIMRDAGIFAGFVRAADAPAVQVERHLSVEPLVQQDPEHFPGS